MRHFYQTCYSTPLRLKISSDNRAAFGAETLVEESANNHAAHTYAMEIKERWAIHGTATPERLAEIRRNYAAMSERHPDLGELKLDTDTYAIFNRRFQG